MTTRRDTDGGRDGGHSSNIADLMRGLHASLDDQEVWSARAYAEQITAAVQRLEAENKRLRANYLRAIRDLTLLYESLGREGWEEGMTESEARDRAHSTLCEFYGDPYPREDRELPPEYLRYLRQGATDED